MRGKATALLLLIAQLAASSAIPAADAVLDSGTAEESTHVEGPQTECTTHHDDLFCQIVRSLAVQRAGTPPTKVARRTPVPLAAHAPPRTIAGSASLAGPFGPRAPPGV